MPARGRCCKQHPRLERHQSLAMHITQSNSPTLWAKTLCYYMALSRLEFGFKDFSVIQYILCRAVFLSMVY